MPDIREACSEDIPEIREVAISTYDDTFATFNTPENLKSYYDQVYSEENLTKELGEPNSRVFIALGNNRILGFARVREYHEVQDILGNNTIELQRLYVLTSAQGKSIGNLLMKHVLDYAVEKNYDWIWLGVWEKNFKAQKFYKKWGFERFSEHIFWQGNDPQTDWLLKKKL